VSLLDITAIGLQIILPLSLIAWLALAPMKSRLGFFLHALSSGLVLTGLLLVAVWLIPPWWMPYLFLGLWLMAVFSLAPDGLRSERWYPRRWTGRPCQC
jgi:hypothetical protein